VQFQKIPIRNLQKGLEFRGGKGARGSARPKNLKNMLVFLSQYLSYFVTEWLYPFVHDSLRKYPYSPHRRGWNFLGAGRSVRPKNLKKCVKPNWVFQRRGGLRKIHAVGEV